MPKRRDLLRTLAATGVAGTLASCVDADPQGPADIDDRAYWLGVLTRLADPVLGNLARRELKERMPVECAVGDPAARRRYSHLEALGRLLAGMSPWLELDLGSTKEDKVRAR